MSKFDDNLELACMEPDDICPECGMTRTEHDSNPWIGKPGHCSGFANCVENKQ